MYVRRIILGAALATAMVAAVPSKAWADWTFTPFLGGTFGGDSSIGINGEDFGDEVERKFNYGMSLAWMGQRTVGFEVDFGYAPNFFDVSPDDNDFDFAGEGNVTTLMANAMVGIPIGGSGQSWRPYAVGGIGLLRSHLRDADDLFDVDNNSFGFNLGAGVTGFFTDNVGLRGDLRYFRKVGDPEEDREFDVGVLDFDFWRASVGVTFRFGS